MSKEWHENIPENGVLCYAPNGIMTNIILVTSDGRAWNGDSNWFNVDQLIPLTAEEWWDFAPWQDMDKPVTANNNFLVMTRHREIVTVYLSKHGAIRREHSGSEILIKDCLKWLPLPTNKGDL